MYVRPTLPAPAARISSPNQRGREPVERAWQSRHYLEDSLPGLRSVGSWRAWQTRILRYRLPGREGSGWRYRHVLVLAAVRRVRRSPARARVTHTSQHPSTHRRRPRRTQSVYDVARRRTRARARARSRRTKMARRPRIKGSSLPLALCGAPRPRRRRLRSTLACVGRAPPARHRASAIVPLWHKSNSGRHGTISRADRVVNNWGSWITCWKHISSRAP